MGAGGKGQALARISLAGLEPPHLPSFSLHALALNQFWDCYVKYSDMYWGLLHVKYAHVLFCVVSVTSLKPLVPAACPPSKAYHIRPCSSHPNLSVQPFLHLAFHSLLERILFTDFISISSAWQLLGDRHLFIAPRRHRL